MKAFITLPDRSVREVESDMATIMKMAAKPGCSVFIPACLCGTTHVCGQHRPRGVIPKDFAATVPEIIG